jgi:DNA-binding NarL/FixJ family response regulator
MPVGERAQRVAIVDIRMPPTHTTDGLDAARTIREELPQAAILVLSAHIEVEHSMDLLGGGRGIGYLLKTRVGDIDELRDMLQRISAGGTVIDPALVEELVRARRARGPLAFLGSNESQEPVSAGTGPTLEPLGGLSATTPRCRGRIGDPAGRGLSPRPRRSQRERPLPCA